MSSNPSIVIGVSAVDTAREVLKGVDDKVRQTTDTIAAESDKITAKTQALTERFKANAGTIATTATGLGAGIVGFATSFSTLEKAQTRSDQAQLTYERSLSKLNEMIAKGTYSSDQLAQQQEKVRINQDKARQSQDNLNDTYTNFFANVPSQMIGFGVAAQSIYQMLGRTQTQSAVQTTTSAITYNGALASMRSANIATATTTQVLGNVMRTVFLSNPITLPLIAVSAVIMALAFNVGGLRDRVNELGKAIGDALPFLRPLLNAIGSLQNLFDGGAKSTKDLTNATYELGTATESTKKKVQSYTEYINEQVSKTAEAYRQNLYYVQSTGALGDALAHSNDEIDLAAGYLKSQADETSKTVQENFKLIASHYDLKTALSLNNSELQNLADSLREQQKAQDEATKAAKNEYDAAKKATEAIRDRVRANIEFAQSMNVNIDAAKTTVNETDRIKSHLADLERSYESARKRVEDFAIANGVNVVTAVKATDGQLVNIIGTLAQTKAGSTNTAVSLVKDFLTSKQSVEQYSKVVDDSGLAIDALGKTSVDASAKIKDALAAMSTQAKTSFNEIVIGAQASLLAIAALQDRALVSQFGQVTGIAGTVSTEALTAAGLGNNASLVQSAQSGRLGGVFVAGKGRVLDTGGTLYEDVIGVGKDTGTPPLLHKNELVIPPSKLPQMSRGNANIGDVNVYVSIEDSKVKSVEVQYAGKRKRSTYTQIITSPTGTR